MSRRIQSWIQILFQGAQGHLCETESKTQQQVLKRGRKTIRVWRAQGRLCRVVFVSVQGVPEKTIQKNKNGLRQYADLRLSIRWSSLREQKTNIVSYFFKYFVRRPTYWSEVADVTVNNFKGSGHSMKRKGGICTVHFKADSSNIDLFVSCNSLSKSAQYLRSSVELVRRTQGSQIFWSVLAFCCVVGAPVGIALEHSSLRAWRFFRRAGARDSSVWFWRSNSSMQRMHTSSGKFRFQNFCSNSRTTSSYHTISWCQWNWNSNSIHDKGISDLLGSHLPREEPLRGWVTSQWSRPQSHKFWIAIGTICCKRKRILLYRDGAI